jgi:hypothetical protein
MRCPESGDRRSPATAHRFSISLPATGSPIRLRPDPTSGSRRRLLLVNASGKAGQTWHRDFILALREDALRIGTAGVIHA